MDPLETSLFALPARLAAKADPALVAADEAHLRDVAATLQRSVADLAARLDDVRRGAGERDQAAGDTEAGGAGTAALERDEEVHRITARLRTLRRFGLDLCLGRMVPATGTGEPGPPVYVGRLGLSDRAGRRLLVDWRSPAAEPFFAATHAHPMGLVSRRRYRWTHEQVTDYWDEVFASDGSGTGTAALDDQSAFVASLGASRSPRMRDVLATIQADQDAIIRSGSRGVLVVDGGPGTGKTVVALHRTAYLLHADPRLRPGRGGVLFVGPHASYLRWVGDVLPSLGEDSVRTCTLRELVPGGDAAADETDPAVAALKARAELVAAVEPAVALHEEPPTEPLVVETPWGDLRLGPEHWAEAFAAPDPGVPHNQAREQVWEALLDLLLAQVEEGEGEGEDGVPVASLRRWLRRHDDLVSVVGGAWPVLEAADVISDLWSVPAYLRHCAPGLDDDEVRLLRRREPQVWTTADLPLLDAAHDRLGDPDAASRARRRAAAAAAARAQVDRVVEDLLAADDDGGLVTMLRHDDLRDRLADEPSYDAGADGDALAGPFAHVVVDEAQELTDAEWAMVLRRCPSRSLTVVGDRAQARQGFDGTWAERLARVGLTRVSVSTLGVNYRTPVEVMEHAAPVIRAVRPDADVPTSVRRSGVPVTHGSPDDLAAALVGWLAEHDQGTAAVIATDPRSIVLPAVDPARVQVLTPRTAKGLEHDLVVLLDDGDDPVDRYVAMTRATQRLVVLTPPVTPPR